MSNEFCIPAVDCREARNDLEMLARTHGTDKAFSYHGYTHYYDLFLRSMRREPITLLEIGVYGGASLRMWRDYFPSARIVGMDVNGACMAYAGERIEVVLGDQSSAKDLDAVCGRYPEGFDVVVDDGGHKMSQQLASLDRLFRAVRPGGVYVVEDLMGSYPANDGGANMDMGAETTVERLKSLVDSLNMRGMAVGKPDLSLAQMGDKADEWMRHLCFAFFAKGICFLGKR